MASPRARLFQVHIALDGLTPPIWRRVLVPSSVTLRRMHGVIQAAMGWSNSHLHAFRQAGRTFGRPDPHGFMQIEDDSQFRLDHLIALPGDTLAYEYDFGDSWGHTLRLEEVLTPAETVRRASCIAGARACPPEDCGGIPGYLDFLEAMLDPFHPEHRRLLEWAGGKFDPGAFDLAAANRAMSKRSRDAA